MTNEEILKRIDHTLLKMTSSWEEIKVLCEEAVKYNTASVCVPPSYVNSIHNEFKNLNICTVIGFPLGYSITAAKVLEAERAILSGANEIDMVINAGDVKNGRFDFTLEEIKLVKKSLRRKNTKSYYRDLLLNGRRKNPPLQNCYGSGSGFYQDIYGFWNGGRNAGGC